MSRQVGFMRTKAVRELAGGDTELMAVAASLELGPVGAHVSVVLDVIWLMNVGKQIVNLLAKFTK